MHLDMNSNMKSIFNTDERTNERDEDGPSAATKVTGCNARARVLDGPALIGELTPADLWPVDRHPVIRSGERDVIPPHVRAAVWFRDRGKCEICGERTPSGQPCHVHGVDITHPVVWRCPVIRGYKAAWTRGEGIPTWHRIAPLTLWPTVAYCAHCDAPGLTSVTL